MRMGRVELDLELQGLGLGLQRVLSQWDRDGRQMEFRHDCCRAGPDCMGHTIITFSAEASDKRCDCNIDVSGFACTPYGLDVNVFDRKTQEDAEDLSSAQDLQSSP